MNAQNVSILEVIAAARTREASLVPESAGYLMLGLGRAMAGLPLGIDAGNVMLNTDGVVALVGPRARIAADDAAKRLRALLARLLDVSQGSPITLREALVLPADDKHPLDKLFVTVTKALIPINRGAAKRALARLARETLRAKARGLELGDEDLDLVSGATAAEAVEPKPLEASAAPASVEAAAASSPAKDVDGDELGDGDELDDDDELDVDVDIDMMTPTPSDAEEMEIELKTPTPALGRITTVELTPVSSVPAAPILAITAGIDEEIPRSQTQPYIFDRANSVTLSEPAAKSNVAAELEGTDVGLIDAAFDALRVPSPLFAMRVDVEQTAATKAPDDDVECVDEDELEQSIAPQEQVADEIEAADEDVDASQLSDEEHEAQLARRLLAAAHRRAGARRRSKVKNRRFNLRARVAANKGVETVEDLLDKFGASSEGDSISEVAASLKRMMALETPTPGAIAKPSEPELMQPVAEPELPTLPEAIEVNLSPPVTKSALLVDPAPREERDDELDEQLEEETDEEVELQASGEAEAEPASDDALAIEDEHDVELDEDEIPEPRVSVPSRTPSDVLLDDVRLSEVPSIPPTHLSARRRGARGPLALSLALLVAGLCAVAFVYLKKPDLLAHDSSVASPAIVADGSCLAELELKDLPKPHEVLLRLGASPFTSRPLPSGVPLELIAMAPGHLPERLVVPPDASWNEVMNSRRLRLEAMLEKGSLASWPGALPGKVGGVGPAGMIEFTATPRASELWLVAAAGEGETVRLQVPCHETARLLVVNPNDPSDRRRLSVEPKLLRAAASNGPAQLSAHR